MNNKRIAVLIPCYNEEATVAKVVQDFRTALPNASIYVYDNNSTDLTREVAHEAGAIIGTVSLRGKGNVLRRMFQDIEADIYLIVDGDDTYDASAASMMIRRLIEKNLDMVNGRRITHKSEAYRSGHRLGNVVLTAIVASIFGNCFQDMLSGYRVFSRRFVKSFPALTTGFEIETELTVHTLELSMAVDEIDTVYKNRPKGSVSKLKTYRDGLKILKVIAILIKEERPFQFFSCTSLLLAAISIGLAWPIFITYLETGMVPRFPTAILATGCMLLSFLCFFSGLLLDTVTRGRREIKRLHYLKIPAVNHYSRND